MPEKFLHLHPTMSLSSSMPQPHVLLRLQGEEGDRAGNPYPGILGAIVSATVRPLTHNGSYPSQCSIHSPFPQLYP